MKRNAIALLFAAGGATILCAVTVIGQTPADTVDAHVAAAKTAAASAPTALLNLCNPPAPPAAARSNQPATPRSPGPPDRATWAAEPVKVFDNLYYVGEKSYSAWAVTTSAGIIIVDAIYDYSVEAQVVGGLKKLGLDPATIKYVVVSHAHRDHAGGAAYLQERLGARVILSAADWDQLSRAQGTWPKPKRDMTVTDGEQLTLGDTTLTFYMTPGHTPGTISTLIPVKDGGRPHVAALWGGTGFNFTVSAERPMAYWFDAYITSAERIRDVVAKTGADVFLSNHPSWDGSDTRMPALATRRPGDVHPYVIGNASLQRYFTVAAECARAGRLRLK
jgi:metallo-beta-lactamase class B